MSENNGPNVPPPPQYPPRYRKPQKGGSKWWVPVVIILGVFVLFFGLLIGGIGLFVSQIPDLNFDTQESAVKVKSNSVLYLDLKNGVPEYAPSDPFANLSGKKRSENLFNVLSAIGRAKDDEKISGIYIRPKGSLPMSRALEINQALAEFKESGKFIYAFIEAGNETTYLSTLPADSIFMPTEGMLELNGYSITSMFFKNMAKKVGVEFTTIGWEDFKSAGDMMSKTSFSDSSEYQLRVMMDQNYDQFLESIMEHRGMAKSISHNAMSKGIYTADKALENNFIDAQMSEYDLKRMIRENYYPKDSVDNGITDSKINLVSAGSYLASNPPIKAEVDDPDKQIAIIYATGQINSGYANSSPFGGSEEGIYSDTFIKHLRKARNDDDIKLIILRIDSPGGSAIASDEMWEEIQLTRKEKPVWASMSSVAASGGYYMSMACDKIYAHPQTITGSIGVILAIPNMSETADMLGITFDTLQTTPEAQFLNGAFKYADKDLAKLKDISWGIYKRFVQRAADARGLDFDEMRSKAKGRVWTGQDALEQGLVDKLGGFEEVLKDAKEEIGVDPDKLVYVKQYPRSEESLEDFINSIFNQQENPEASSSNVEIAEMLGLDPVEFAAKFTNMPEDYKQHLIYIMNMVNMSKDEKVLLSMPSVPTIK